MSEKRQRFVRSHTCGALTSKTEGTRVTLCGWVHKRRDHGGVIFIDLRDRYGMTQIVFDPSVHSEAHARADSVRSEYVLSVSGVVRSRPEGMKNPKMVTGEIEVLVDRVEILSAAKTPPFPMDEEVDVNENIRLKYRYLDLRRPALQRNLLVRHALLKTVRRHLDDEGFVEVETPILYKSTPEGARDFIVPSRLNPGEFYALPQSPQTLKQLLMVSGMDRYYQIARCFRDEDLRADRQPEFSQIDIETSFLDEEAFFPLLEEMIRKVWKEVRGIDIRLPFKRMPFVEAMSRFGSDKPDIRFGLELQDVSSIFEKSSFQVFSQALTPNTRGRKGSVRVIKVPEKADEFSRKDLDDLTKYIGQFGAKGLLWFKVKADELQSPAAKFFSESEMVAFRSQLDLKVGDLVLCVADPRNKVVFDSLGALRLELGRKLGLIPEPGTGEPAFLWVTSFPLFEYDDKEDRYYAAHHPFTSPVPEHVEWLLKGERLEEIQASAYDMVLNGSEIGGGSLRIYRQDLQQAMFRALGLSQEEASEKFGFFLNALEYGTPPHGGIAFGVERLAAELAGVSAIRDVMAFPKTQKGTCLMSETPSEVLPEQLTEVGIRLASVKKGFTIG